MKQRQSTPDAGISLGESRCHPKGPPLQRLSNGLMGAILGLAGCAGGAPVEPADEVERLPSHRESVWRPLRDTFWQRAGRLRDLPPAVARIRVAVLDTAAIPYDQATGADRDGHGRLVGRVIDDLTCPGRLGDGAGCVAEIVNYLALPRAGAAAVDEQWRSSYGTPGDVAVAVERALSDWQRDRALEGGPARLIINLGLGWSPERLEEASTVTLHASLRRASCLGALVVAAAGNTDSSMASGMVLPAAWEAATAPSAGDCEREGVLGGPKKERVPRPLLHAAGAVDQLDRPLTTMRRGAQPRLAGYGLAVVTRDPRAEGGVSRVSSGTSLGAAVVAAAAAVAWAYRPELEATRVMELVYAASIPVAAPELTPGMRRVSICAVARRARQEGAACPPADRGGATPLAQLDPAPFAALRVEGVNESPCAEGLCEAGLAAEPWAVPQPGGGGCDTCAVRPEQGELLVALPSRLRKCIRALRLTLTIDAGRVSYDIPLAGDRVSGSSLVFTAVLPDRQLAARASGATLWMTVHGSDGVERTYPTAIPVLR